MQSIPARIANELNVSEKQIDAAVALLDEGATVPFIARYRKEVTGGLDDIQLRSLQERLGYLREMEERRTTILNSIEEQGKLTLPLKQAILDADTKTRLEDLYLPYKPKRRTKGQIAIEAGLEPLADALFNDHSLSPEVEAEKFIAVDNGITDTKAALDGAKYILMERFAEDADLLAKLRDTLQRDGQLSASLVAGKEQEGAKFSDYFEHTEPFAKTPSHRALAMFRGRREGVLNLKIDLVVPEDADRHPCEGIIVSHTGLKPEGQAADNWLAEVVRWTWRVKLHSAIETELMSNLRESAEAEAIKVFATNLKDLLLAAPAGQRATLGLDPGLRTGVKVAVIDNTGRYVDNTAIFPHAPQNKWDDSIHTLAVLCQKYQIELVAIGNGTASRETDKLVGDLIKRHPELKLQKVMVNEAGASVYSASEFASREFPELDVTVRGAISIARRLQDPLAELVKIDPKSIGVGQYQHDVSQTQLAGQLDHVVEDCVNGVGVEVNTASAALLKRVSGLNQTIADNIVAFRDQNGAFANRASLKAVPRLGDKTFEQAAGFLRIGNGDNPLDRSSVHPESYAVVEAIARDNGKTVESLIGDSATLRKLDAKKYVTETVGLPTITDILRELEKPGRDPRPEFKTARFEEGVETLKDLEPGMVLEGTVTNVTNFGAFIDIGVHQDGLVHISALSHSFVKDPREVVKAGDVVKVKVMEVDNQRKRIGLSMRMDDQPGEKADRSDNRRQHNPNPRRASSNKPQRSNQQTPKKNGTFADLFANAKKLK